MLFSKVTVNPVGETVSDLTTITTPSRLFTVSCTVGSQSVSSGNWSLLEVPHPDNTI
ncbi:hypothetical protein [Paucisalibacillus globulus]|uniref:hypothetical protein n=1 Tax=Paucisalibacillus globulus TaxID=351095 RepID=UPI001C3EC8DD|nr:hypothetical protein [Paucisalibacillus globulus]